MFGSRYFGAKGKGKTMEIVQTKPLLGRGVGTLSAQFKITEAVDWPLTTPLYLLGNGVSSFKATLVFNGPSRFFGRYFG